MLLMMLQKNENTTQDAEAKVEIAKDHAEGKPSSEIKQG